MRRAQAGLPLCPHRRRVAVRARPLRWRAAAGGIRIVESGHSVDLLAPGTSKMNLYLEARRSTPPGLEVLCTGDSGGAPGNDSGLLGMRYSPTVDDASGDPSTCWNRPPRDVPGRQERPNTSGASASSTGTCAPE